MDDPRIVYLVVSGFEAALGLALAWLFLRFWRQWERPYLRLWAGSFAALAVYLFASAAAFLLARPDGSVLALRTLATFVAQFGAYVHIGLLVLGTLSLLARREPAPFLLRGTVGAAVVLALVASLLFSWDPEAMAQRVTLRVGLRYLVAATAYAAVALALLWAAPGGGLGRRLTGLAFALFAQASLAGLVISTVPEIGRQFGNSAVWLALFDLVAVAGIGIGLFVWLHDEERARAEDATLALERARFFDPGTRLPNRRLFVRRLRDHLDRRERSAKPLGVLVLRPDRSARLRDALGEDDFDVRLLKLAQFLDSELGGALPPAARLEDDRITAVLASSGDEAALRLQAERLLGEATRRFDPGSAFATLSGGLAIYPQDGDGAEALVNAAVSAQGRAEQAGGARLLAFSAELQQREREELALLAQLQAALKRDALAFALQPIVSLTDGQVAYREALLRWEHPEHGPVPPNTILALADSAGLMPEIDRWALRHACRLLAREPDSAPGIAVNLTAPTFLDRSFPDRLEALLRESGVPGRRLTLEITEAIAMGDPAVAADVLARLRPLGVRVALDDVGTGYSSLDQLRRLEVDILKVDRAFVADIGRSRRDEAVARALITLGNSLGLSVVVEGIETRAQFDFARREGAHFGQGFLLGQPGPTQS